MPLNDKLKRQFRRIYGADLLPVSLSSYYLGDIIEWDGFIKKQLDFENISLIENLKIDESRKADLRKRLSEVSMEKAFMQKITIDSRFDIKGGADIPNFATSIGAELGFSNFVNFNIEDVQCKVLARGLKVEIINLIKQAKEDDRKHFRKNLRDLYFIDKLFYAGNASFEIKTDSKAKVEAAVTSAKLVNPNISFNREGNIQVSFTGNKDLPFAADFEPLRDLID